MIPPPRNGTVHTCPVCGDTLSGTDAPCLLCVGVGEPLELQEPDWGSRLRWVLVIAIGVAALLLVVRR